MHCNANFRIFAILGGINLSATMKAFRILIRVVAAGFAVGLMTGSMVGCDADGATDPILDEPGYGMSATEQRQVHDAWRVDIITSPRGDMLAEYSYDGEGRLVRKNVSDILEEPYRTVTRNWDERYLWENGRVVKKTSRTRYRDSYFGYDESNTVETALEYDSEGRLHKDGFAYDGEGHLIRTYSYEFAGLLYEDGLVWENGNVVRHISESPENNAFGEPMPDTRRVRVAEYEYDDNPKPNFGLDGVFSYVDGLDSWPYTESTALPRSLSRNNLTKARSAGYEYRYTYNVNGLPETVHTIWLGIDADEPMIQTIVYKRMTE